MLNSGEAKFPSGWFCVGSSTTNGGEALTCCSDSQGSGNSGCDMFRSLVEVSFAFTFTFPSLVSNNELGGSELSAVEDNIGSNPLGPKTLLSSLLSNRFRISLSNETLGSVSMFEKLMVESEFALSGEFKILSRNKVFTRSKKNKRFLGGKSLELVEAIGVLVVKVDEHEGV